MAKWRFPYYVSSFYRGHDRLTGEALIMVDVAPTEDERLTKGVTVSVPVKALRGCGPTAAAEIVSLRIMDAARGFIANRHAGP